IQGRYGYDMEFDFVFDAAKEVSTTEKDVSTAEQVSTAGAAVTTASFAVSAVSPTRNTRVSTANDISMAETLVYIRKSAAKDKGKGKAKMDEYKIVKTKTKLQQEQERLDFEAYRGLQAKEREKYTEADQARMLAELINQRKRYFATQRAKERRNKPPTQAQQRTYMSNYIKHMGGYTLQQLRGYSFDEIKTFFETTIRSVNTFVPIESEKVTEPFLRLAAKRMNVEALQTKYTIIDWEIYTEGTRKYWKIISVGNHTKVHQFFDDMLKSFDMDDLVMLWSLVKEKFNSTKPTDDKEKEIWVALKRLFEPDIDDEL
ncbi:hypothetical protein Tco_1279232, partial [Tanacetum coccineum]